MFVLYNAALRGFPAWDVESLMENKYETTIFVIASGIAKLSKVTTVPPTRRLYRGLGGMLLPDQFWRNLRECQAAVVVRAGSQQRAEAAASTLCALVHTERKQVLDSQQTTEARVLRLEGLAESALDGVAIRVLTDAKIVPGWIVRMLVVFPISKWELMEGGLQSRVAGEIARKIVPCDVEGENLGMTVALEDLADKPEDFKGGGEILKNTFPRHVKSLVSSCYACTVNQNI